MAAMNKQHDTRDDQGRWQAVLARDASAGGFVYGVTTTGVFCRPGCASRAPKRGNVRFFADPEAAREAGFRPCRRCKPDSVAGDALAVRAVRLIEAAHSEGRVPTLAELGEALGVSGGHVQRQFRQALGVSPREYAARLRREALQEGLRDGNGVADALYGAGYGSPSRIYEDGGTLGMTPATYAKGGRGACIAYALADCALDRLLVAATERGVCAVYLGDDDAALEDELRAEFPKAEIHADDDALAAHVAAVLRAVDTGQADLLLDVRASAFQTRVWEALRAIPCGETRTYGEIADSIGAPGAARAVGSACGRNPVSVVVPCHRALRSDGGLGGYRWGLERKQRLLEAEGAITNAGEGET